MDRMRFLRTEELEGCPACASTMTYPLFSGHDSLHGVPGLFRYEQCGTCGTVFQSPRVIADDLHCCYPADYFTHEPRPAPVSPQTGAGLWRACLREAVLDHADRSIPDPPTLPFRLLGAIAARLPPLRRRARYGLIDSLAFTGRPGDRCLEVGFGQGAELRNLARLGWAASGVDPDGAAVEQARRHEGIDVRTGTLLDSGFPDEHFALVYMHHSLEHIAALRETLVAARKLLRPGGRLVAVYPNPHSLGTRIYGTASPNWDPPRHLVLPSPTAIETLLSEVGFGCVKISTRALRAAPYSAIARHYRHHPTGAAGLPGGPPRSVDRWLARLERAFVALGAQLGEEVVIDART